MSGPILEAIRQKREQLPKAGLELIRGDVPAIRRHLSEIKDRELSRTQIYRLVGRDQKEFPRPGLLENVFDLFAAISLARTEKGEAFINEIDSWSDWRDGFGPIAVPPNPQLEFWTTEEELNSQLSELRKAFIAGNGNDARESIARIRYTTEKLSRLVDITLDEPQRDRRAG